MRTMSDNLPLPAREAPSAAGGLRRGLARLFGAGLITGAADDDPSGIATYSQAGAAFGYALSWTMLVTLPLLAAVQEIAGRVGRVTGRGLTASLSLVFPRWVIAVLILLLAVANTANLGADLGAMGEAAALVLGGPPHPYVIAFGLVSGLAVILIRYSFYVRLLRWLTLALLAYVAAVLLVPADWGAVVTSVLRPRIALDRSYLFAVVAVFGTTIAPYLVFWQAAEEVEDSRGAPLAAGAAAAGEFRRIRLDTWIGITFSNLVGLSIMITAAATLKPAGIMDIGSAEQAAQALRPLVGPGASLAFAIGIIGTGLLAVPVLAGSAAYAFGEALGRPVGLGKRLREAPTFYGIIALSTVLGTLLHFTLIDPMKALVGSAVINGILVVPILAALLIVAARNTVMGQLVPSRWLLATGWATVALMSAAGVALAGSVLL